MAFEDRCSPQSAPSPPGIPHSPHNGHSHHQQLHPQQYTTTTTNTTPTTTSSSSSASTGSPQLSPVATAPTMHAIKQEPLSGAEHSPAAGHELPAVRFSISNILSDSFGKVPAVPANPLPTTATPKSHKMTGSTADKKSTLLFRPYDHISRQSSASPELAAPQAPSASSSPPLAASLHAHHQQQLHAQAALLQHQQHQHYLQQQHHHHQQQQQQHHQHAFMQQQVSLLEEMRLAQFRLAQQQHEAAVLDFSRAAAAAAAAAAAIRVPGGHPHHPMVLQPQPQPAMPSQQPQPSAPLLFNTFNMQAYPKIHEEIRQHQQQQQQQHHLHLHQSSAAASLNRSPPPPPPQQQPTTSLPLLSDSSFAKIPPLGNLCKTVSQIGQPSPRPQPSRSPTSSVSSSSASSTASSLTPVKSAAAAKSAKKPTTSAEAKAAASVATTGSGQPLRDSGMESSDDAKSESGSTKDDGTQLWPAWVYCTRYSDRPSSGPRYRKPKVPKDKAQISDEKRPRTAFSSDQLARLKREFIENRYLTERRRQQLSAELGLNEAQIKIWFQNKRAKIKKTSGNKNPLALQLMAQGLYNHSTVPLTKEEEELEMRMNGQIP